jgi:cytochrome c oxidase subunit 4
MTQPDIHHSKVATGEEHGHGGSGKYIAVFVALCVLTGASFFTTSDLWPFHANKTIGWSFMMAVSCTKAMLVILFFMHLLWEANWKYVLTVPAVGMSVFLVCMLIPDIGLRYRRYAEERRTLAVERVEPAAGTTSGAAHDGDAPPAVAH